MISIKGLTKIYKSKKRKKCKALDDINLTLPDTGLVFILGKSGSGKSTLLNLIGGLDSITEGKIEVDGNELSSFREKDFCNYRNSHIAFIFQDYHLIDELTVYDNIVLSLDLERRPDRADVAAALKKVGLDGYADRYPHELSGGEQQRVAIARAIVKQPKLILADEPTGNLDTVTAKAIVELLRELSKECLILIVSHNLNDANAYADRIIQLSRGKVIDDKIKNPTFSDRVQLDSGTLVYPIDGQLNDADLELINQGLEGRSIERVVRRIDKFIPTPQHTGDTQKIRIAKNGLSTAKSLGLSGKFLKNQAFSISLSAFMVAVIMVILSLAQTIISFDANRIIDEEMHKAGIDSLYLIKNPDAETQAYLEKSYHVELDGKDIDALKKMSKEGNVYPVYNVTVPITEYRNAAGLHANNLSHNSCYLSETLGTIIVDEAFLAQQFGEIKYAAKRDYYDPAGIIITDYIADCILQKNTKLAGGTYEDLLGGYAKSDWSYQNLSINAILDTGYSERHAHVIERIKNKEFKTYLDLYEDSEFLAFSNEIYEKLGFTYSLNPDFAKDFEEIWGGEYLWTQKLVFNDVLVLDNDTTSRYYAVNGTAASNTMTANWRYTNLAPEIPRNAKYIRVTYATSKNINNAAKTRELPIYNSDRAYLVFSDGTVLSTEQQVANGEWHNHWIDAKTGAVVQGTHKTEETWVTDFIEIPEGVTISEFCTVADFKHAYCAFYDENQYFIKAYKPSDKVAIENGTIYMNYQNYNQLFGTSYNDKTLDTFVPHKVKLAQYRFYDVKCEKPLFEMEVTITKLVNSACVVAPDVGDQFAKSKVYANALYCDRIDNISEILNVAGQLNYTNQSSLVDGIQTMTAAVEAFVPIFELVNIVLCLGTIFIFINFSTKLIHYKLHEIGILKALGTKNNSIMIVFGVQILLVAILTCILATVGYYFFIDLANDVLFESLQSLSDGRVVLEFNFLCFEWNIALMDCALVLILAAVSLVAPMIKIRNIKPVKIIKARE